MSRRLTLFVYGDNYLKPKKEMSIGEYIDMWDSIVKSWLCGHKQQLIYGEKEGIQFDYMPEPYIGNPYTCAFVIVNLNPGVGHCHAWEHLQGVKNTLINKVQSSSYSAVFKDFPYLKDEMSIGLINWDNCSGRKWWIGKERWIKHLLQLCNPYLNVTPCIPEDYLPFAMELIGWHSERWLSRFNKGFMSNGNYSGSFKTDVLFPLYEAIDNSKYKFAYCVGKPIGDIIESYGDYKCIQLQIGLTLKNGGFRVNEGGTIRNYRVLRNSKKHYIINTWTRGSNAFPASSYDCIEKQLLSYIFRDSHKYMPPIYS